MPRLTSVSQCPPPLVLRLVEVLDALEDRSDRSGRAKEQRTGDLLDDDIGVSGLLLGVLAVAADKGVVRCNLGYAAHAVNEEN